MSNTTVPISEWCKEIRVALAKKETNLQNVAQEIGYSYTTITALISGRIVKKNYLDIAKKINEGSERQIGGHDEKGQTITERKLDTGFSWDFSDKVGCRLCISSAGL